MVSFVVQLLQLHLTVRNHVHKGQTVESLRHPSTPASVRSVSPRPESSRSLLDVRKRLCCDTSFVPLQSFDKWADSVVALDGTTLHVYSTRITVTQDLLARHPTHCTWWTSCLRKSVGSCRNPTNAANWNIVVCAGRSYSAIKPG